MKKISSKTAAVFFIVSLLLTVFAWWFAGSEGDILQSFIDTLKSQFDFRSLLSDAEAFSNNDINDPFYGFGFLISEFEFLFAGRIIDQWIGDIKTVWQKLFYFTGGILSQMFLYIVVMTNPQSLNLLILFYFPAYIWSVVHYGRMIGHSKIPKLLRLPLYIILPVFTGWFNPFMLGMLYTVLMVVLDKNVYQFLLDIRFLSSEAMSSHMLLVFIIAALTIGFAKLFGMILDFILHIGEKEKGLLPVDRIYYIFTITLIITWILSNLFWPFDWIENALR